LDAYDGDDGGMNPGIVALLLQTASLWAPPAKISVSEWADQHRYLSPESGAQGGKRWKSYSYQREPMDAFSDPSIYRVVVKSATQMLKTETILNAAAWMIDIDPGPAMLLCHRNEDARELVEERIDPMVRDTPALHGKVWGRRRLKKNFRGGMLVIKSGGSPSNVASRALRYLFFEEVDKYVRNVGDEGNIVSLGRKRLATFKHQAKEILSCSPTYEGSQIDRDYERSDKREFFVKCPHCEHEQSMIRKFYRQVRWNSKLSTIEEQAQSARYHCENPECDQPWTEEQRQATIDGGRWIAQAPFNGIAGFWISELYSRSKELWQIVLDFLQKKDSPEELRTFVNTSLAENWAEQGETPDWEVLVRRREGYAIGTVPAGALVLVAGADVHPDRIEVEILGLGRNRETWSIAYEIFEGNTANLVGTAEAPSPWEKLQATLGEVYPHELGGGIEIKRLYVDSGNQTQVVYRWARQQVASRVTAIKGVDRGSSPVSQPTPVDVNYRGKLIRNGLTIRTVVGPAFKEELYAALKKPSPTEDELKAGARYPEGFCHFPNGANYGDEHFRQLCAEQLVTIKDRRGRMRREWQQLRARNEALDCRVYAMAAAYDIQVQRYREEHWKTLEDAAKANLFGGTALDAEPAPQPNPQNTAGDLQTPVNATPPGRRVRFQMEV
jgi:phage terminase large subunit GpA-like protein